MTTLVLTPVFIVGSVVLFMLFAFRTDAPIYLQEMNALVTCSLWYLAVLGFVTLWSPGAFGPHSNARFIVWAALPWFVMVALAHFAGWPGTIAGWLWPPFTLFGLLALALLGRAYEPREEYYLGLMGAPWLDNPLTLRDDVDREHVKLGLLIVLPGFLFGSWSELVSSGWLLRPPTDEECRRAAEFLVAMDLRDRSRMEAVLARSGPRAAGRSARLLLRLGLVERTKGGPFVTAQARDLIRSAIMA